jgi:tryptophan-rich sensory protein
MNWTVPVAFGLFLTGAVVALLQLWLRFLDPETFVKTMITFGVVLAIVVAWNLVLRERRDMARLRDKSKLD